MLHISGTIHHTERGRGRGGGGWGGGGEKAKNDQK